MDIIGLKFADSPVRSRLTPKMQTINNQGWYISYYKVCGEGLIIDCDDEKEQDIKDDDEGEID